MNPEAYALPPSVAMIQHNLTLHGRQLRSPPGTRSVFTLENFRVQVGPKLKPYFLAPKARLIMVRSFRFGGFGGFRVTGG